MHGGGLRAAPFFRSVPPAPSPSVENLAHSARWTTLGPGWRRRCARSKPATILSVTTPEEASSEFDLASVDALLTGTRAVRKRLDLGKPVDLGIVQECLPAAITWHTLE